MERWRDAVDWLRAARTGEARGVLKHPDVPDRIDVIWGQPDTAGSQGFGLAKIEQKHPEVLQDLPERLARMTVVQRGSNRIRLRSDDAAAVVRLDMDGEKKTWLLTAFERR